MSLKDGEYEMRIQRLEAANVELNARNLEHVSDYLKASSALLDETRALRNKLKAAMPLLEASRNACNEIRRHRLDGPFKDSYELAAALDRAIPELKDGL